MQKYENTQNGYILDNNSNNETYQKIAEQHKPFKAIICNASTSKRFTPGFMASKRCITINNKIPDNVFYFNRIK